MYKPTDINAELHAVERCALLVLGVLLVGTLGFHLVVPEWDFWDSFYFTIVTITTVGYGDYGLTRGGQMFASVLMVAGFGVFTYSLGTLVAFAADSAAARRRKMKREIAKLTDHVIVCGYGRMGSSFCDQVERAGKICVVIEEVEEAYKRAVADGRLVMRADASDDAALIAAGIERAAGLMTSARSDAANMYIAVTARDLQSDLSIIARAETKSGARKLKRAGVQSVVLPNHMAGEFAATALLHPRLSNYMHSDAENSGVFDLGEVVVEPGSEISGQSIAEFGAATPDLVFVAIEHPDGQMVVRPRGNEVFGDGDVVIFAGSEQDAQHIRDAALAEALAV